MPSEDNKSKLIEILENLYKEHKEKGDIVKSLDDLRMKGTDSEVSLSSMRKIVNSGILVKPNISKRNPYYIWGGGDEPNYSDLADDIMQTSSRLKKTQLSTEPFYNKILQDRGIKISDKPKDKVSRKLSEIQLLKISASLGRNKIKDENIETVITDIKKIIEG